MSILAYCSTITHPDLAAVSLPGRIHSTGSADNRFTFGNLDRPQSMYREGNPQYEYHLKTYGGPAKFGYKDFIPQFTAERFDPDEWAELFKYSGAQYAGPVGEHHDGFCM